MATAIQTRPKTAYRTGRSQSYETTYQREFSALRRASTINEGVPAGQRFPIGCPYQINDPIGVTSYTVDYIEQKDIQREPVIRPNTSRANRPHPHPQFTHWPRRPATASPVISEEIKQALRNQWTSTYQMDFIGAPQGFPLPMAYNRSRSFWRNRAYHTLDSEYRRAYEKAARPTTAPSGRFGYTSRIPADAIIPLTLPMYRTRPQPTTYVREFNQKAPSEQYTRDFVDSFSGPINQ